MKRILVAGGAGFLGSNLCKRLVEENNYVICIDNLVSGRKKNIENLLDMENFEFIEHDIIDPIDIKIDEIYNAACPASPKIYQKYPINTIKTSVLGAINLLDLATKYNAKYLQFSTSEVYGEPLEHPQKEIYRGNVNNIGIRGCYDESKRLAETLCYDYNREFKTRIKIVRIFNTYGINMDRDDGRVISNFVVQAINREPVTIYGDGKQTRSFCFVSDMVEALIQVMNSKDEILGPINLGNPEEINIIDVAEKVIKMTNSTSKIVFKELPKDDPVRRKPDISLAKKLLNWSPKVSLEEGLRKTVEYFIKEIQ